MFGGIVETIGQVKKLTMQDGCMHLIIQPKQPFTDLVIGESIAVNGACLTVTEFNDETFSTTVVPETLRLTNLEQYQINHFVNLERSLKANDRIGGHYVQGHIDAMGEIIEIKNDDSNAWLVKITVPTNMDKYIVRKGYITLDGMSITIIDVTPTWFTVTLIPHTQMVTIAHQYRIGQRVNIEVDMMGKYIEKLLESRHARND